MNKLFSLINGWAEKLTVSVLRLSGASSDSIDNVTNAFASRDSATTTDQKQIAQTTLNSVLPSWFKPVKTIILLAIVLGSVFLIHKFIKKHKLFKR